MHTLLSEVELLYYVYSDLSFELNVLDGKTAAFCLHTVILVKGSQAICIACVSEFGRVICCDYTLPITESEQTSSVFSENDKSPSDLFLNFHCMRQAYVQAPGLVL